MKTITLTDEQYEWLADWFGFDNQPEGSDFGTYLLQELEIKHSVECHAFRLSERYLDEIRRLGGDPTKINWRDKP